MVSVPRSAAAVAMLIVSCAALAAGYPAPKQADWVARDFRFHTGEVMPELRIDDMVLAQHRWMMRRLLVESIRSDPDYQDGNYTKQPRAAQVATTFFAIGTGGGNWGNLKVAPTREKGDEAVKQRIAGPFRADANDLVYQWESSFDYDAARELERIEAVLLAINAADDERNPPELGVLDREIKRVRNGRILLIPASERTTGHGTTGNARFYRDDLEGLLRQSPRR